MTDKNMIINPLTGQMIERDKLYGPDDELGGAPSSSVEARLDKIEKILIRIEEVLVDRETKVGQPGQFNPSSDDIEAAIAAMNVPVG